MLLLHLNQQQKMVVVSADNLPVHQHLYDDDALHRPRQKSRQAWCRRLSRSRAYPDYLLPVNIRHQRKTSSRIQRPQDTSLSQEDRRPRLARLDFVGCDGRPHHTHLHFRVVHDSVFEYGEIAPHRRLLGCQ